MSLLPQQQTFTHYFPFVEYTHCIITNQTSL